MIIKTWYKTSRKHRPELASAGRYDRRQTRDGALHQSGNQTGPPSDEDLPLADFSGQPVDDDRHAVARIIDEKPFAGRMGLPHRDRQPGFEGAIEFAKPGIAVTAWGSRRYIRPRP
jgi:hypothetical protein